MVVIIVKQPLQIFKQNLKPSSDIFKIEIFIFLNVGNELKLKQSAKQNPFGLNQLFDWL